MGFCKFAKFNIFSCGLLIALFSSLLVAVFARDSAGLLEDRTVLLSFMMGIDSDPENALANWKSSITPVCNWTGVRCSSERNRVTQIVLNRRSLGGIISPVLSNLSSLLVLDLSHNFFRGRIPMELGFLIEFQQLDLSHNLLEGNIPQGLGFLQNLSWVSLRNNKLTGEIPPPLFCNCSSLEAVDLSNNSLSGEIPLKNECKFIRLKQLQLWSNQLFGEIPRALSNATNLEWLDLESNYLMGELPAESLHKLPRLQYLYLSHNKLVSHNGNTNLKPFFSSLLNSSNFQELVLAGNNLGGQLPSFIGNLSGKVVQINLAENRIHGSIPTSISNLVNLSLLNLTGNRLNGLIPAELSQLRNLERAYLSRNLFSGELPRALGNAPHLGLLDLSKNKLTGSIPDNFGNLSQLIYLFLNENQFSGTIPRSLGNCTKLGTIDLSHNRISGLIPGEVAGLDLSFFFNLSNNLLHGPVPLELSKMVKVTALDLSENKFSGTIPTLLENCIGLEYLNLSGNYLQGPLPVFIGQLPNLRQLDVSRNRLNGSIPESLESSLALKKLNFSFNYFCGNISSMGSFALLTTESFLGNPGLCGSIVGMPDCSKKRTLHFLGWPVLLSLLASSMLCICGYPLLLKSGIRGPISIFSGAESLDDEKGNKRDPQYPKISYQRLLEATSGFSSSSLIGSGRFGHVYKGVLQDNTSIAVKVIHSKTAEEVTGSFKRECQVLKRTRHRNLIQIIAICSKPDFKALVLPLMSRGSLERHLYPSHNMSHGLSLVELVSICCDVANGMAYLHHYSPVKVVHCDLKPSNILLNDDMTALLTDFGIARLVNSTDDKLSAVNDITTFCSTDGLLCGTVGYIAPEYGLGKEASTQGDVYSFGVLLLEIVTGMRPTDVLFEQGSSLHEWVKSQFPDRLDPIIEEALARSAKSDSLGYRRNTVLRTVILELIELGLMCTQYSPSTRPTMSDVAQEMGQLKLYLSDPSSLLTDEEASSKEIDAS